MEMKSLSFLLSFLFLYILISRFCLYRPLAIYLYLPCLSVFLFVRLSVHWLTGNKCWIDVKPALHFIVFCDTVFMMGYIHSFDVTPRGEFIQARRVRMRACLCVCVCVCLWWGRSGGTQSPTQWGLDGGFSSRPQQVFLSLHATAVVYRAECFVVKRLQFLGRCERFVRQPSAIPCSCRRFTELKLLAKTWNCLIRLDGKVLPLSD